MLESTFEDLKGISTEQEMAPQKGITLRTRTPSGEICPSKFKSKRTQGSVPLRKLLEAGPKPSSVFSPFRIFYTLNLRVFTAYSFMSLTFHKWLHSGVRLTWVWILALLFKTITISGKSFLHLSETWFLSLETWDNNTYLRKWSQSLME